MAYLFKNFAISALAADVAIDATTMVVVTGAKFPNAGGGSTFLATLWDGQNEPEIVECTNRGGSILTVVRAQESTAAYAWRAGTQIRLALTAAQMLSAFSAGSPNGIDWPSMTEAKAEELAEKLVVGDPLDTLTAAIVTANFATAFEAGDGSVNDKLMSPLRTSQHFEARTTAYTRNFLLAADDAEMISALSLGEAAVADFATLLQAEAGTNETTVMSPYRTYNYIQAISSSVGRDLLAATDEAAARTVLELQVGATSQLADQGQAETGTNATRLMTPERTTDHFNFRTTTLTRDILSRANASTIRTDLELGSAATLGVASQGQAETGTDTGNAMTPARTTDFFDIRQADAADAEAGSNNTKWMSPDKVARAIRLYPAIYRTFEETSTPSTPASGQVVMWFDGSGDLKYKGSSGTVKTVTAT